MASFGMIHWGNTTSLSSVPNIQDIIGSIYIAMSIVTVVLNFLVCFLIFRTKRMKRTPKYWLVLAICAALIIQALGPNSLTIVALLASVYPSVCWVWSGAVVYANFVGIAIVTYTGLLTLVDFLLCLVSTPYTRRYRSIVVIFLMVLSYTVLLASIMILITIYGNDDSYVHPDQCVFRIDNAWSQKFLIWIVLFVPVALSGVCCVAICVCRSSRHVQRYIGVNTDIFCSSIEMEVSSTMPPSDHVIFLFLEILLYLPWGVVFYLETCSYYPSQEYPLILQSRIIGGIVADNAGVVFPLSWLMFKDMRKAVKRLFNCKTGPTFLRTVSDGVDFQMFDTYPYCMMTSDCI